MSICDKCVKRDVCCDEGMGDEALTYCVSYLEERPTCETCNYWNCDLKYCYHWAAFMEAEDYCSEHEDRGEEE